MISKRRRTTLALSLDQIDLVSRALRRRVREGDGLGSLELVRELRALGKTMQTSLLLETRDERRKKGELIR